MSKKLHTNSAQPAAQAAVTSTSTPSTSDQPPNTNGAGRAKTSHPAPQRVVLSSRERDKLRSYLHRRLRRLVGLSLFDDILRIAAFKMLADIEGRNGAPGTITRDQLFATDGAPTDITQLYIEEVFEETLRDNLSILCDLEQALTSAFDEKILRYYEAQWTYEKRHRRLSGIGLRS